MAGVVDNLLEGVPPPTGEGFREVLRCRNLVIEQILSSDRPDPDEYCQEQDEWVVLLQGHARLELAGTAVELAAGDSLFIPAGARHRVLETSRTPHCVWIAVHLYPG